MTTAVRTLPSARSEPPRTALHFTALTLGNLLVLLDVSILNVALPDVARDLHASSSALPWTVDAYTVVFAGLLLASGALADRWGAPRVYRTALAAFALLSLACALAPSAGALIGGRALLGVAAAGLVPASLALLAGLYPDAARRTRAIGAWAALSSVGLVLGPLLGGVLTAAGGWRWVFLVNPPLALAVLAAGRGIKGGTGGRRPVSGRVPLDRWGVALSVVGLAALSFGLIEAGTGGWLRPAPVAALVLSAAAFAALARVERRSAHPVLPPALFAQARLRADLVGAVSGNFAFYGSFFFLAQRLAAWHPGLGPVRVGLMLLPMTLPICFVPLLTGRLTTRFGAGPVVLAGLGGSVLGGLALSRLTPGAGLAAVSGVQLLLAVSGALAIPALTASVAVTAPKELAGTAQGALNAARQSGSALGVAVIGTLAGPGSAGLALAAGAAVAVGLLIAARAAN